MLNTKNPRAHELAVQLSRLTGQTLTEAVIVSLEHEIERRRSGAEAPETPEDLMAFLCEVREDAPAEFLDDPDPTAWLYDSDGLPA